MSLFARRKVKKSSSRKAALLEEDEPGSGVDNAEDSGRLSSISFGARTSAPVSSFVSSDLSSGSSRNASENAVPASAAALAAANQIREQAAVAAARSHASSAVAARASLSFSLTDGSHSSSSGLGADAFDAFDAFDATHAPNNDAGTVSGRLSHSGRAAAGVCTPRGAAQGTCQGEEASRRPAGGAGRGGLSFSGLDDEADDDGFFQVKKSKASKRLQREKEREARSDNLDRFEKGKTAPCASPEKVRGAPSSESGKSKLVLQATGLRLLVNQTHRQRPQFSEEAGDGARGSSKSERGKSLSDEPRGGGSSRVSSQKPAPSAAGSLKAEETPDRRDGDACWKGGRPALAPGAAAAEKILSLAELEEAEARQRSGRVETDASCGVPASRDGDEDDVASMARLARAQRQRARMIEKGELIPADSAAALTGEWGTAVRLKKRQQQQLETLRSWRDDGCEEAEDGDEEEPRRESDDEGDEEEDPALRLKEQLQLLKVQERQHGVGRPGENEEEEAWEAWEREKILKGAGRKHLLRQQQLFERRQQEQQEYLQQQVYLQQQGGWTPADALQQLNLLQQQQRHQQRLLNQLANPQDSHSEQSSEPLAASTAAALGSSDGAGGREASAVGLVEAPTSAAWLKEVWGVDGANAQARAALAWLKEEAQQLRLLEVAEEEQKEERRRQRANAAEKLRLLEVRQLGVGKRMDDLQDFLIFVEDLAGFILAKEGAVQQAQATIEEMEREVADKKFERRLLEFDDCRREAFRRTRPGQDATDSDSSSDDERDEFGRSRKYTQKLQRSDRAKARRARRLARRQSSEKGASHEVLRETTASPAAVRMQRIRQGATRAGRDTVGPVQGPAGQEGLWGVLGETLGDGWATSEEEEDGVGRLRRDRSKFSAAASEVMEDVAEAFVSVAAVLEEVEKMKKWCGAEFAALRILEQVPDMIKTQVRWQLLWWNPLAIADELPKNEARGDKTRAWVSEASLENFDWFLELGLFIDKLDELSGAPLPQSASSEKVRQPTSATSKEGEEGSEKVSGETCDPSTVMSEVVKQCVVPRAAAALKCTDITSFASVHRAAQLLGELLLFRDENSLPHLTKVLQDFVAFVVAQVSALLPADFVKQVVADVPQFPPSPQGCSGEVTQDEAAAKKELVELFLHRALKIAGCCACFMDILSDSLLLHICMQEIFVDRVRPLLPTLPPSEQLVVLGAFIHLLPLRWVLQLQEESPGESGATPRMQQLLGAVVALGEAVVDEAEQAEVLLLLKKLSPQEEAEKIQRVFEQRHGQRLSQQ
ncbi:hypothetical protein TGMAS_300330 [Toxoplasma gondii MAS]|uniref:GC-rich sequence DNA-binding factor-like protein n=1 Tax=Toxoplasma gondii MAS TaxID=943118 RepID=A0A086PVB8_TOXGO|nr:hypothetical protein TGMAS_300330 [Toxoplasma gondii MAS]